MNMEHYTDWTCRKREWERCGCYYNRCCASDSLKAADSLTGTRVFSRGFKVSSSKVAPGAVLALFLCAMTKNSFSKLWPVDDGSGRTPRDSLEYGRKPDDELLSSQNELSTMTGNNGQDWHFFCIVQPLASLNIKANFFCLGRKRVKISMQGLNSVMMIFLLLQLLPWQGMPQILFVFQLSFPHKTLLLMSSNQQEINDWYRSLTAAVR